MARLACLSVESPALLFHSKMFREVLRTKTCRPSITHPFSDTIVRFPYQSRSEYLTALDSRELICTGVSICLIISRHVEFASLSHKIPHLS